jgi:hypothetical protein
LIRESILESSFEHDVFEGVLVVLLAGFVEVIHVELSDYGAT